jgi:hypothetical protein
MSESGNNRDRTSPRPATGQSADRPFDPKPVIERLRQNELDAQQRVDLLVLWMRKEHPDAQVMTELAQFNETMAVVKATVDLPSGAEASGYGSAVAADGSDMVERAETKAIGRALNVLGYSVESFDGAPAEPRQQASESQREPVREMSEPVRITREPVEEVEEEPVPTPPRAAAPSPAPPTPETDDEVEVDAADYSWTAFWRWARPLGFENRGAVEAFLGQTINNLTPGDVRRLIRERNNE